MTDVDPVLSNDAIRDTEPYADRQTRRTNILCDPQRNVHRWIVLFFICFLNFGNYFCFDNPAALADRFTDDLKLSTGQYGLLYSIYSWPNVVLALFGGFLMDRVFGLRWGAIIFASFIAAGQVVFGLGALFNSFGIMILGRLLFAVGGESLAVAQNTYCVKWFRGKELNTVFGITISFARIGSTINMYVMEPICSWFSKKMSGPHALGWTLLLAGAATTLVSWLCSLVLSCFDKRRDTILQQVESQQPSTSREDATLEKKDDLNTDVVRPRDILKFPASFWILCVICVAYYAAVFPFIGFGLMFFINKYQMDAYAADVCNSLVYLISIGASPLNGMLVDFTGRNVQWIIVSVSLTMFGHGLMAFSFVTPYAAMAIIGWAYSLLAASLWPCVALIVPSRVLSTAYGCIQSIQNLGLALLFLTVGAVVDAKGYLVLELYFLIWLSVALCATIGLWFYDSSGTKVLTMSAKERKEYLDEENKKSS